MHDICERRPFPFPDKFFGFAICCHTLEDIRDPIHVCTEISRVAKAGYVEFPSPYGELTRGRDPGGRSWVGYNHHRWIVSVENGELVFLCKPHFLHSSPRFHFPPRYSKRWEREGKLFTGYFWQGEVRAREKVIVGPREWQEEFETFVRAVRGDTISMKFSRARQKIWDIGVRCADALRIRGELRSLSGKLRWWY